MNIIRNHKSMWFQTCFIVSAIVFGLIMPVSSSASPIKHNQAQFGNSCETAVQASFSRAVTLLHSFEYPESPRILKQ